jgi:hypothetical protein
MRIFVLTATYELRVSRKTHLRDDPSICKFYYFSSQDDAHLLEKREQLERNPPSHNI